MQGPNSTSPGLLGSVLDAQRITTLPQLPHTASSPQVLHQVDSRAKTWGNQPHPTRGHFWAFLPSTPPAPE